MVEPEADLFRITPRQAEVWRLIAHGYTNREIAHVMKISLKTVEEHAYQLYQELGLSNRAYHQVHRVRAALLWHGIDPPPPNGSARDGKR